METTQENNLFKCGTVIADRYSVIKTLGAGGVGMVLQVTDRTLDNEVCALKLLFPHLARDEIQFARFRNEVLIARKLGHPNIVRLYDFGIAGRGYYYLSMEFVSGGSLGQKIYGARQQKPAFQEVLKILYEVCEGLACAHRYGIVHRDLKPDNVLLTDLGAVKISDFGLARSLTVDKGFTDTGETVGTPYYMAPEQLIGQPPDPRMDIYSLGIMAYEMVVGRRPFFHENYLDLANMHLYEDIPDFATKESGIPRWFQDWVQTCGQKKKEDRFQTAKEAAEMLINHSDDEANTTARRVPAVFSFYTPRKLKKRKKAVKRLMTMTGVIVLLACLTFGGTVWLMLREPVSLGRLFAEVGRGNIEAVRELLDAGKTEINANAADAGKRSVLSIAVRKSDEEMTKLLLARGADPNMVQPDGLTPFLIACREGGAGVIEALIGGAATLNSRDPLQNSGLHLAIVNNRSEVVRTLLRHGMPKGLQDKTGATPLMLAVKLKNPEIASLLLEANVEVDKADDRGFTPLMAAVQNDDRQMVEKLLAAKAKVNEKNNEGKTAFQYASREIRSILQQASTNNIITVRGDSTPEAAQNPTPTPQTRLVIFGKPSASFSFNGGNPRHQVQVTIRNMGDENAEGVAIFVRTPDGKEQPLKGPERIIRKQESMYSEMIEGLGMQTKVDDRNIIIRCKNCR